MEHIDFLEVIKNGKYYFPATDHYLLEGRNRCNFCMNGSRKKYYRIKHAIICEECSTEKKWHIRCDMCQSSRIPSCIGWKDNDLCLKCVCSIDSFMIKQCSQANPEYLSPSKIVNDLVTDLNIDSDKHYKYDYAENDTEWEFNITLDEDNNILKIIVEKGCYLSIPCKHEFSMVNYNHQRIIKIYCEKEILSMLEIREILKLFPGIMVPAHMKEPQ